MMKKLGTTILWLTLAFAATTLRADDAPHPLSMWQVDGASNRVYLLGSIHLLREQDHPLPTAIYSAYEDAEKLIMELDMDDMDPIETQTLTNELGLIKGDETLGDLMGDELFAEAERLAAAIQIPLALLAKSEPWYAAMNVEIMLLMRMGFDPSFGIETHLMTMAGGDGKEILGLETMRQQLGFLDNLSPSAQRDMLMQALSEGAELDELMDTMIDAWRIGDIDYMENTLLADMQNYPELNDVIVVNRNRDWANQIEQLLDDEIDYLIVVGALHLIGDEGVPELLESRGHDVMQLQQPAN